MWAPVLAYATTLLVTRIGEANPVYPAPGAKYLFIMPEHYDDDGDQPKQLSTTAPGSSLSKGLRYEEYIIEHEISNSQARNAVLALDYNNYSPPGCQTCSQKEIEYCRGSHLVNDHCCCDGRSHEILPFIPHTCYFGTKLCKTIAHDCEEYSRVRTCCCDRYALQKWKDDLSAAAFVHITSKYLFMFILVFNTYFLFNFVT